MQIATKPANGASRGTDLCLHTLRADCNCTACRQAIAAGTLPPHAPCRLQRTIIPSPPRRYPLPPHAPCRLQRRWMQKYNATSNFASTRSVQIATKQLLTLGQTALTLPPHAPCRLQHSPHVERCAPSHFASTRSVQIATALRINPAYNWSCFASTRSVQIATMQYTKLPSASVFASTRSVQIATAEMHRMQYALFRTCVELVDSFSVLNKAMLR